MGRFTESDLEGMRMDLAALSEGKVPPKAEFLEHFLDAHIKVWNVRVSRYECEKGVALYGNLDEVPTFLLDNPVYAESTQWRKGFHRYVSYLRSLGGISDTVWGRYLEKYPEADAPASYLGDVPLNEAFAKVISEKRKELRAIGKKPNEVSVEVESFRASLLRTLPHLETMLQARNQKEEAPTPD